MPSTLVPVDHEPDFGGVSFVPVDHNPFSADGLVQQARAQLASQPERFPTSYRNPEADAAAMSPETFANPYVKGLIGDLATLPKRAIDASTQDVQHLGEAGYTPTAIGPAVETAMAMAGTGMPMAEKGAAGIFGGRLAQTADHAALARAEEMASKGAHPDQIWKDTGWFQGPDQKWRFEIDDSPSVARPGITSGGVSAKLDHPELYAAYPGIENTKLGWGSPPRQGSYNPPSYAGDPGYINISQMDTLGQQKSVLMHELQHAVQNKEGFTPGANFREVGRDAYQKNAGEVEARNVQRRLFDDAEIRRSKPPVTTEDYPRNQQLLDGYPNYTAGLGLR